MKRSIVGLLSIAFGIFIAANVMAYSGSYVPGQGINGTVHDLGTPGANGMNYGASPDDPLTRICIYCHAPHNTYRLSLNNGGPAAGVGGGTNVDAPDEFDYLPLWNHTLQANTAYAMYQNGPGAPQSGDHASQAIVNDLMVNGPGSSSLLCLSCHDGSVAVNSYGNDSQLSKSTGNAFMTPKYQIGGGQYLGNHHPIGFNYDDVQGSDTEIRIADNVNLTPTSTVRDHLFGNARVECGTCHSVHNKGNSGETLLWRSDKNSELCLTCHDKGTYNAP